jgi:beta-lactamase regulating signal transducer with metallopeptidase domain
VGRAVIAGGAVAREDARSRGPGPRADHEWAHVQRRDDIFNVLHVLVRLIGGWHPALWWIERRLHVEREIACDEVTVAFTGSPKSYAECLVKLSSLKGISRAMQTRPPSSRRQSACTRRPDRVTASPDRAGMVPRARRGDCARALCLSVAVGGMSLVKATHSPSPVLSAGTFDRRRWSASSRRPLRRRQM